MLVEYNVDDSRKTGDCKNVSISLLSNDAGLSVRIVTPADDIIIDCIDEKAANRLYNLLCNDDDYRYVI